MDVSGNYCGNHFVIYVNQTIKLYNLNLYSDIQKLYPIKLKKNSSMYSACLQSKMQYA